MSKGVCVRVFDVLRKKKVLRNLENFLFLRLKLYKYSGAHGCS